MLAACEKSPSDAVTLNYDPRNPFDICSLTFTPIYRGNKVSRDMQGAAHRRACVRVHLWSGMEWCWVERGGRGSSEGAVLGVRLCDCHWQGLTPHPLSRGVLRTFSRPTHPPTHPLT